MNRGSGGHCVVINRLPVATEDQVVSGEQRRPVSGQRCDALCTRGHARLRRFKVRSFPLRPSHKELTRGLIMSTDELVKYTVLLYSLLADTFV